MFLWDVKRRALLTGGRPGESKCVSDQSVADHIEFGPRAYRGGPWNDGFSNYPVCGVGGHLLRVHESPITA